MIKILIGNDKTSVDFGTMSYKPTEITVDGLRAMRAIIKSMEQTSEYKTEPQTVRMEQAVMINVWLQYMMGELRMIEQELPRKARLQAVKEADAFLSAFARGV